MDGYMDVLPGGFAGRLEVIEGRSGRRRWSDEEKARIASESYRPGVQVADVARRHGTTRWQIYDWRKRLETIIGELRRERFGPASEKLDPEQFNLPLEDVEIAQGILEAAQENARRALKGRSPDEERPARRNRGHLPTHLPRIERVIEPASTLFRPWLEAQLSRIPRSSKLAEDIRYTLGLWPGLVRFLDDGRLEMDANPVENQIRRVALTRKNALFAGHEVGAENWAMLASLVATCKMSDVNPVDYIAETLRAILDGHPSSQIENLMPWHFRKTSSHAA